MTVNKKSIVEILFAFIILAGIFTGIVSAITASIGNSRMILRAAPEEIIQRSILVRNVNDVPVTIEFSASGDLAENIKFKDESFELESNAEKKVYFTIIADEAGRTETKIDFVFKPKDGSGVGLASTIIIIADEKYSGQSESENNNLDIDANIEDEDSTIGDLDTGDIDEIRSDKLTGSNIKSNLNGKISSNLLIISTVVLSGLLIGLYFYYLASKPKKEVKREDA